MGVEQAEISIAVDEAVAALDAVAHPGARRRVAGGTPSEVTGRVAPQAGDVHKPAGRAIGTVAACRTPQLAAVTRHHGGQTRRYRADTRARRRTSR
jgi:hypothetical protein